MVWNTGGKYSCFGQRVCALYVSDVFGSFHVHLRLLDFKTEVYLIAVVLLYVVAWFIGKGVNGRRAERW